MANITLFVHPFFITYHKLYGDVINCMSYPIKYYYKAKKEENLHFLVSLNID